MVRGKMPPAQASLSISFDCLPANYCLSAILDTHGALRYTLHNALRYNSPLHQRSKQNDGRSSFLIGRSSLKEAVHGPTSAKQQKWTK
jgi:hypothetical protein